MAVPHQLSGKMEVLRQIAAARKGINIEKHVKPNMQACRAATGYNEDVAEKQYQALNRKFKEDEERICGEIERIKNNGILVSEWVMHGKNKAVQPYVRRDSQCLVDDLNFGTGEDHTSSCAQPTQYGSPVARGVIGGQKVSVKQRLQARMEAHKQITDAQMREKREAFEAKLASEQRNANPLLNYRQPFPKIQRQSRDEIAEEKRRMTLLSIERDMHRTRNPVPTKYLLTDEERRARLERCRNMQQDSYERVVEAIKKNDLKHKQLKQRIESQRIVDI